VKTLNEILLELAGELKDNAPGYEFTAYSRKLLLVWLNDGLCLLARWRPDLFSRTRTVTLAPGSEQSIEGCSVFGSVVAMLLDNGKELPVRRSSYMASRIWRKPECLKPPKFYVIDSYSFDTTQKTTFYVHPAVPPGKPVRVKIVCSEIPADLDVTSLDAPIDADCYQLAMTRHYALAQAYAQDSEQTNLALAAFHMGIWNNFLPAAARADAAFAGGSTTTTTLQQQVRR